MRWLRTMEAMFSRPSMSRQFNLAAFLIIALVVLIAYSNTFTASFHFDDFPAIIENPHIKRVTADTVIHLLNTNRPVLNLTLMMNYQINGLNVVGWHIVNIILHMANGILVYLLIVRTLTLPALSARYGDRATGMALFVALLFAVHPVQTESVTYIINRSELLATAFSLGTFLLFISGAQTGRFRYYIGAFFTSLLAMGSKEWAVTLPAMIFLYDFLFLSKSNFKTVVTRWKAYVLLLLPWGLIGYILTLYRGVVTAGFGVTADYSAITPWTYLLTSCNVLWTYIRLLLLPINQNLDYDYPLARTLFALPTLLSVLGHGVVAGGAFWLYKKKGWLLLPFGVAWFYMTLSPTQSFVPILDVIFEHRLYFPSIGFFIALIAAYGEVLDWVRRRKGLRRAGTALKSE